ncbi:LysR family transcriptional regulator [Desulfobacula sp.]|uniref:LysR family transcriptional regulator n=1 Tax=Desulfobacula sp. TaxID=2593537 RepID=UPI00260BFC29|nr:LysR family transcriptional regulator [Desulfobacula sp.]
MINLNQLRAFYQAAKHMNFSTAAKKLFITQPAVTAHLKLFEDHLELKLFKKKGGKLYLTDEGKTLYDYSKKIFDCEKEIETVVEEIKKLKRGTLRIGTARTYARYCMPFLIAHFREPYPHIKIEMDEGSSKDMIQSLFDFKNELVVVAEAKELTDICFVPFSREEMILILPPDHHLAHKKTITFQEVADEPIIMKEPGSGTRRLVNELFAANGCAPKILMQMSNAEMTKLLVQHGEGISFLASGAVEGELKEKKLATVPLKGQKLFLDVSIAYLKDQPLSPPAQIFIDNLETLRTRDVCFQGIDNLLDTIPPHYRGMDH